MATCVVLENHRSHIYRTKVSCSRTHTPKRKRRSRMAHLSQSIKEKTGEAKEKIEETAQHLKYKATEQLPKNVKISMDRRMHLLQQKFKTPQLDGNPEILFEKDGVFLDTGDDTVDNLIPGKIFLCVKPEGRFIEWKAQAELCETKSDGDWSILEAKGVGYKATQESEGDVTIVRGPLHRHIVSFDVLDLKSIRRSNRVLGWSFLIFILKDGHTYPPLHFHNGGSTELKRKLGEFITIQRSNDDPDLYVVHDHDPEALKRSFNELDLFTDHKKDLVSKFVRDPYTTTMSGFSRFTGAMRGMLLAPQDTGREHGQAEVVQALAGEMEALNITTQGQVEPGYEVVSKCELPPRPPVTREDPVSMEEWGRFLDPQGRVTDEHGLKMRIFKGGLEAGARETVWKFLLGVYPWDSTSAQREETRKKKENDYFAMKLQWKTLTPDQIKRNSTYRERSNLVEKDVARTDRLMAFFAGENNPNLEMLNDILMTYCMFDADLGYVQGMSDLLAPLLVVMKDEVAAFWCLTGFMDLVGTNFELEQRSMKKQLADLQTLMEFTDPAFLNYLQSHESSNMYFCFRWLLILFKREFSFPDIMTLWEVMWTGVPCKNFHLLISLAILEKQKSTLTENKFGFTEILKHINDLSLHIPLQSTLVTAESIYHQISTCPSLTNSVANILGIDPPLTDVTPAGTSCDDHWDSRESSPARRKHPTPGNPEGVGLQIRQKHAPPRPPPPHDVKLRHQWPGGARALPVESGFVIMSPVGDSPKPSISRNDSSSSIEVLSDKSDNEYA